MRITFEVRFSMDKFKDVNWGHKTITAYLLEHEMKPDSAKRFLEKARLDDDHPEILTYFEPKDLDTISSQFSQDEMNIFQQVIALAKLEIKVS